MKPACDSILVDPNWRMCRVHKGSRNKKLSGGNRRFYVSVIKNREREREGGVPNGSRVDKFLWEMAFESSRAFKFRTYRYAFRSWCQLISILRCHCNSAIFVPKYVATRNWSSSIEAWAPVMLITRDLEEWGRKKGSSSQRARLLPNPLQYIAEKWV